MKPEDCLTEAKIYLEIAENQLENNPERWNPTIVNCTQAIISTIDAGYLEFIGYLPKGGSRGHEQTSKNLQELYQKDYISEGFSANIHTVKKWTEQRKSEIQYKYASCSKKDAEQAYKGAKNLYNKMKKEI